MVVYPYVCTEFINTQNCCWNGTVLSQECIGLRFKTYLTQCLTPVTSFCLASVPVLGPQATSWPEAADAVGHRFYVFHSCSNLNHLSSIIYQVQTLHGPLTLPVCTKVAINQMHSPFATIWPSLAGTQCVHSSL